MGRTASVKGVGDIGYLKTIAISLNNIFLFLTGQISSPSFRGNQDGWDYLHVGKSWFYFKTITYTGIASTVDLSFISSIQLNRIEQVWNDNTTKSYSVRMFSNPSLNSFSELEKQTGNINTNRILQLGDTFQYPSGSRLRFYCSVNTNLKTNSILIQAVEL